MPSKPFKILILGGTGDARHLAERLAVDERISVITSLAGVTREPAPVAGALRTGGFGGAKGLQTFVLDEHIDLVIDAAHPFAVQISANAVNASRGAGIPCLRLERPPWHLEEGDRLTSASDVQAAADAVPKGARAFVTVGRQEVAAFLVREDISVVARMIEPPDVAVPDHAEVILARPPFVVAEEKELMETRGISVLVTKNSGGTATEAKIVAARELGLQVIMVVRPGKPPVPTATQVDEMVDLIERRLG